MKITRQDRARIISDAFREMGSRGGKARAKNLSKAELSAIGRKAALARWGSKPKPKEAA